MDYRVVVETVPQNALSESFQRRDRCRCHPASDVHVELSIYKLLGQRIRVLRSQEMAPGVHRVVWNGVDDSGYAARSGTYFVVLDSGVASGIDREVQRLQLLR